MKSPLNTSARPANYGRGEVTLDLGEGSDERIARLKATLTSPSYRPPLLPAVALEVIALAGRPNVTVEALVRQFERDPLLAGQVLRLARSPIYGGLEPPRSLHAAIVRLGMKTVREVVLAAAMNAKVFKTLGYTRPMDSVRRHSTAVAHLTRLVARFTPLDAEQAFIFGLVHDAGLAAGLLVLGEPPPRAAPPPLTWDVWLGLDAIHAELGRILAESWQLPPEVQWLLGSHHGLRIGGVPHPMLAVLAIAEGLAGRLGFSLAPEVDGLEPKPDADARTVQQAAAQLALTDAQTAAIDAEADRLRPWLVDTI